MDITNDEKNGKNKQNWWKNLILMNFTGFVPSAKESQKQSENNSF